MYGCTKHQQYIWNRQQQQHPPTATTTTSIIFQQLPPPPLPSSTIWCRWWWCGGGGGGRLCCGGGFGGAVPLSGALSANTCMWHIILGNGSRILCLGSRMLSSVSHLLVSWLSDLMVSVESYCTSGLELDQLTQPSSANLRRLLTRSKNGGAIYRPLLTPSVSKSALLSSHTGPKAIKLAAHSLTHSFTHWVRNYSWLNN